MFYCLFIVHAVSVTSILIYNQNSVSFLWQKLCCVGQLEDAKPTDGD